MTNFKLDLSTYTEEEKKIAQSVQEWLEEDGIQAILVPYEQSISRDRLVDMFQPHLGCQHEPAETGMRWSYCKNCNVDMVMNLGEWEVK